MRKLSKRELTAPIAEKKHLPTYDVVVSRSWAGDKRKTFTIACQNEIEAARIIREQFGNDITFIHSITLRDGQEIWA